MAISSPGIGSKLDVNAIVSQLVALEKRPLTSLQTAASSLQARLSAFGQLRSQISNLADQAAKLANPSTWDTMRLVSSDPTALSGTASASAQATSFSFSVSQLAASQSIATGVLPRGTTVGAGTLSISIGTWSGAGFDGTTNPASFTPNAGPVIPPIEITATDTLSQVSAKINAANAGVTATVLQDASGERLLLRSSATGQSQGFRLTVSDVDLENADGNGLSRLDFNPAVAGTSGTTLAQAGKNTLASINGVDVQSSDNRFENIVEGVTLTVTSVTTNPVNVTISPDTEAARASLNNFATSYNTLVKALAEMTRYNPSDKTAGTLQGDSTAINLQSALRRLIGSTGPSGNVFSRLSDVGLQLKDDGTLLVNEQRLNSALNNRDQLKSFFSQESSDPALDGFGVRVKDFTNGLLSTDGLFAAKTQAIESARTRNSREQERISDKIARTEARLLAQYTRLDSTLAKLSALDSYVAQQVTNWNNQNRS